MFQYPLNNSKTNWELLLFQMVSLVNLDGFLSLIHSLRTPCGACLWLTGALLSLASQRVTSSCGLDHAASHSVPGISMPASAALHQSAAICPFRQQAETPLSQSQAWGGVRLGLRETPARYIHKPHSSASIEWNYQKRSPQRPIQLSHDSIRDMSPRLQELQCVQQWSSNKQASEDSQRPLTALIWVFLLINKSEQKLTVLENNYVWRFMMKTWVD